MTVAHSECYTVPPRVHARCFDDELVILDLNAGQYFSLCPVGSTIWECLVGGGTRDDAVAKIVSVFEIDDATAQHDVADLVAELVEAGLFLKRE